MAKHIIDPIKREKIEAYAKELYMVPGKYGKRKHSLGYIAAMIQKKYKVSFSRVAILNWAKAINEYGSSWDSEYLASLAVGVSSAEIKKPSNIGKETAEIYQDKIVENAQKYQKITRQVHSVAINLEQGYLAVLAGTYKSLLKTYGKPEDIPKEKYDESFSRDAINHFCAIERVMHERLEKMQDATVRRTPDGGSVDFKRLPYEDLLELAGWKSKPSK